MSFLTVVRAGRGAADDLARFALGLPVAKAKKPKPDPLTPTGFDAVVLGVLEAIKGEVAGVEADAMRAMLAGLEVDWAKLSAADRTKKVRNAAKYWLAIAERRTPPAVGKVLAAKGAGVAALTKAASAKTHKLRINPSFSLADQVAVDFLAQSQAHYIRDALGNRMEGLSGVARTVVASGLERGLDRYDIGRNLATALNHTAAARADSYWRVVASTFVARSRAWSVTSSFQEAGIGSFQLEAVLDEITTEACRHLHGRVFSTGAAMARYQEVAASPDPEAVKQLQPWVYSAKTGERAADGSDERALFYKHGDQRIAIATVLQPGFGKKDAVGTYQPLMSGDALQKAGIMTPPFHGHCRTTLVPVFGAVQSPGLAFPPAGTVAPPTVLAPPAAAPVAPPAAAPVAAPAAHVPTPRVKPVAAPASYAESHATLTFGKTPPADPEVPLNGVAFGPPSKASFWLDHQDVDLGEPPIRPMAGKKPASGCIVLEPDGRMWVVEPAGHYMGVEHTFPKGKVDAGLSAQQNALKEVFEESGLEVEIVGHVGDFEKTTSTTRYYIARRKGGQPWTSHYESQAVKLAHPDELEKMLNVAVDKEVLKAAKAHADALAKGKPPPLPVGVKPKVKPLPAPVLPRAATADMGDADNILHQQTGGPKGSNKGGFYTGKDGVARYVKFYDDPAQAYGEHLANAIYRDLGLTAPTSELFMHEGRLAYASRILDGKTLKAYGGPTRATGKRFADGFVGDVLTGNWDAVGTGFDNVMVLPGDHVARIDSGGSFLFRAQAGRKPLEALDAIEEWDVFFSGRNPYYRDVIKAAGYDGPEDFADAIRAQVAAVTKLRDRSGSWGAYVARVAPGLGHADRVAVIKMLESRTALLEAKVAEMVAPGAAPIFHAAQASTVVPKKGLTFGDLPESDFTKYMTGSRYNPDKHASGESFKAYKKRAEKSVEAVAADSRSAISSFTGSGSTAIRASEDGGTPDARSNAITEAFKVATPMPGTVFRGIGSRGNITERIAGKYLEHATFGLGVNGGATSSTSWLADSAIDFMDGANDLGRGTDPNSNKWKILYVIKQRRGIAVETISSHDGEHEVLLSREMKFRTTGLSRLKGTKRVLVVEAEEIEP